MFALADVGKVAVKLRGNEEREDQVEEKRYDAESIGKGLARVGI